MSPTAQVLYAYEGEQQVDGQYLQGLRRTSITYPNGRLLRFGYNAGADDAANRPSFLADDDNGNVGQHLAEYA